MTTTPRPDALTEARAVDFGDPEVNALWDEAVAGHIEGLAPSVLIRAVMPRMAAARADAERELAALRAIVARYKVPLPLLRAAIESVRPYAGFHDDVRVITAADAFADILGALAKEEGS